MNSLDFPFVDAAYRTETITRYAGNPFVEALPALPDDKTLQAALMRLPAFDPTERVLPAQARIQRLDLLQTLVVPLPRLVRLARAVIKLVHTGYGARRPFSAQANQTLRELYAAQQQGKFTSLEQPARATQHNLALLGASGCGKSFSLQHIASLFPPAIYHEQLGKWQLPFLFIEMSWDGASIHTLAERLFKELDRLLPHAGYTGLFMERKGLNAEQRLAKALSIAYEHAVGAIVVDESQNQRSPDEGRNKRERSNASQNAPRTETPLTKLLITASNTSHVPLVLAGTLEMRNRMGGRFSLARRMSGRGSAAWEPLSRGKTPEKPGEFEVMLHALWKYQWLRQPVALDAHWKDLFFELTQGIPDIMVKLYESSQEAAIANSTETLTPALVRAVFDKEFVTTEFGIRALRTNDTLLRESVPDLCLPPDPREELTQGQFAVPVGVKPGAGIAVGKAATNPTDKARSSLTRPKPARVQPSPEPMPLSNDVVEGADLRQVDGANAASPGANSAMGVADWNGMHPA